MENLKSTALLQEHLNLQAKMVDFAEFYMPIEYQGIIAEHMAVRNNCGVFDVSHMGEFIIEGKEAIQAIDYLFTNKVQGSKDGRVIYGMLCNEEGNVIDDLFVCKINEEKLFIVVNASNIENDYQAINKYIKNFDVTFKNVSDDYSEIALQGPESIKIMEQLTCDELSSFKFMTIKELKLNTLPFLVSRSGYTGEDGFEIYGNHNDIITLWKVLINEYNVTPCGLGARDTLRYEAALPLYGHEMSFTINPFEAGMGFGVKLDKEFFIGKEALINYANNLKRKIVGIELLQRNVPRNGYEIYKNDLKIGEITTGYLSPSLNKPLALALIDIEYATLGEEVEVVIRNKRIPAIIVDKQFYKKNYKK